jgi:hypothetical protein
VYISQPNFMSYEMQLLIRIVSELTMNVYILMLKLTIICEDA